MIKVDLERRRMTISSPRRRSRQSSGSPAAWRGGWNRIESLSECGFCTQALHGCVYGSGWPLAISWQLGFSGKGFHILNIVELRAKAHFTKRQLLEGHLHIADYGVASFEGF